MGKILVIVESPTKAKHIAHILGPGYIVKASMGHVRDLPVKRMGLSAPDFVLDYETTKRGAQVLSGLRSLVKSAQHTILATDPDREGEAIAWHLKTALHLPAKKTSRVTYGAVTESAVRAAFDSPRNIDMDLVHAQEARRGLDRLVGYTLSGVVSDALSTNQRASAGRVQTPTLRLVVEREREREREAHRSVDHYGARVYFDETSDIWADWDTREHLPPGQTHILDRALSERASKVRHLRIIDIVHSTRKRDAPPPFTTSTLLQSAATIGIAAKCTMAAAQSLFENGDITYHRSDSVRIEPQAIKAIREYALGKGYPLGERANVHRTTSAGAQEAHEAIRPTSITRERVSSTNAHAAQIYALIHARALGSQLAPQCVQVTDTTLASDEAAPLCGFKYHARGMRVTAPGYSVLKGVGVNDTSGCVIGEAVGERVIAHRGMVVEQRTQPKPHYTEATLLRELERRGIGRPSTWASILTTLHTRHYTTVPEKPSKKGGVVLLATELGRQVIDAVSGAQFALYDYTAKMEHDLDAIANGKAGYKQVMSDALASIERDRRLIAAKRTA